MAGNSQQQGEQQGPGQGSGRGGCGTAPPPPASRQGRQQDGELVSKSKEMAQILRHDPPEGMDGCGFVPLGALTAKMEQPTSGDEVVDIVESDNKGRYQLLDGEDGQLRVRAVQGHSVPLKNPLHDPICSPEEVPALVLHATSPENWEKIRQSGELRRMHRTHIHFASEPKHLRADDWACVLLQVDLGAAIKAGIPFCKAANNVILSEGPIPLAFVHRVMLRDLPEGWQREIPGDRDRLLREEQ